MKKLTMVSAILSWALFVASLWLPAVTLELPGWQHQVRGWEMGVRALFFSMEGMGIFLDARLLLFFLHGATNFLMLLCLLLVLSRRTGTWRWLAHAMLGATLFNASLTWRLEGGRVGYYVWVASFAMTTTWLYLSRKRRAANPTMSSNHPLQASLGDRPSTT